MKKHQVVERVMDVQRKESPKISLVGSLRIWKESSQNCCEYYKLIYCNKIHFITRSLFPSIFHSFLIRINVKSAALFLQLKSAIKHTKQHEFVFASIIYVILIGKKLYCSYLVSSNGFLDPHN